MIKKNNLDFCKIFGQILPVRFFAFNYLYIRLIGTKPKLTRNLNWLVQRLKSLEWLFIGKVWKSQFCFYFFAEKFYLKEDLWLVYFSDIQNPLLFLIKFSPFISYIITSQPGPGAAREKIDELTSFGVLEFGVPRGPGVGLVRSCLC